MQRKHQKGFTLMELMVVIVIVAILAAVAVPLYINYVKDAARTEAKGAIGAIITAEQTTFQQADHYVNATTAEILAKSVLNCDLTEASHNWDFEIIDASPTGFTAKAHGKAAAAGLYVDYVYDRVAGGAWHHSETPPGP